MSRVYQTMNSLLFHLNVKDTQVGIKMFKRKVLEGVMPKMMAKRYAFDVELLAIAKKQGYDVLEAPTTIDFKFESMIKVKSVLAMISDTLAIFYRLKILRFYDDKK